jgi:hypothetical protein
MVKKRRIIGCSTREVANELWIAREILSKPGARTDLLSWVQPSDSLNVGESVNCFKVLIFPLGFSPSSLLRILMLGVRTYLCPFLKY